MGTDTDRSFDGDFIDVNQDGDLDIVTSNADVFGGGLARFRACENVGNEFFADNTASIFPTTARGFGFDVEAADFTGDGPSCIWLVAGAQTAC